MIRHLTKRFLAFAIDYLTIVIYALLLFGIATFIQNQFNINTERLSPITGQIIGLITLTIPIFLYFYCSEKSLHEGTLGKRWMHIAVTNNQPDRNKNILIRNILKFLPWEIAHFGVHWLLYYSSLEINPPIWVWIALITPQVIVIGYFISIILFKGESSFYDNVAHTKVMINR